MNNSAYQFSLEKASLQEAREERVQTSKDRDLADKKSGHMHAYWEKLTDGATTAMGHIRRFSTGKPSNENAYMFGRSTTAIMLAMLATTDLIQGKASWEETKQAFKFVTGLTDQAPIERSAMNKSFRANTSRVSYLFKQEVGKFVANEVVAAEELANKVVQQVLNDEFTGPVQEAHQDIYQELFFEYQSQRGAVIDTAELAEMKSDFIDRAKDQHLDNQGIVFSKYANQYILKADKSETMRAAFDAKMEENGQDAVVPYRLARHHAADFNFSVNYGGQEAQTWGERLSPLVQTPTPALTPAPAYRFSF